MKRIVFPRRQSGTPVRFPPDARTRSGFELREIQKGENPTDWKPMASVGPGVREIRVSASAGAFRVLYVTVLSDAVLVLHAFQKKTKRTSKRDIDIAAQRLRTWKH